ncbi:hypothetical protein OBBRIDRAFT_793942 [Obba rivulosa]|uniref:Uncharacterized protein n=1 Tax=Obba rivulosa TaxID=1052685 RepID=A0A8E2DJW2_9APHY|nr:hypothetical protein OBBRIDRAFT_793942 [Obba rivulosa]
MQPRSPLLRWHLALGWSLFLFGFAQVNVTLNDTAPEIVYSPPACNASTGLCDSSWQIVSDPDVANGTVTSTVGPTAGGGDLIPQLFLTFQGTALYIRTSSFSTAVANITLSTTDPVVSITTEVNTSIGLISAIGLPANKATILAITYIVTEGATARLDIGSITITSPTNKYITFLIHSAPCVRYVVEHIADLDRFRTDGSCSCQDADGRRYSGGGLRCGPRGRLRSTRGRSIQALPQTTASFRHDRDGRDARVIILRHDYHEVAHDETIAMCTVHLAHY